jgi:hypothetical protein
MFTDRRGPIEEFTWGSFRIQGKLHAGKGAFKKGVGKDIRLVGEQVSAWKERKGHLLEKDMITGVLGEGVEVLILGLGVHEALECPEYVATYIQQAGIPQVIKESTPNACRLYNDLYHQGKKIALLAHGTC